MLGFVFAGGWGGEIEEEGEGGDEREAQNRTAKRRGRKGETMRENEDRSFAFYLFIFKCLEPLWQLMKSMDLFLE